MKSTLWKYDSDIDLSNSVIINKRFLLNVVLVALVILLNLDIFRLAP